MSFSKPTTRQDRQVYLIGTYSPLIEGSKLPSKVQVLRVLFFNLREVKLSLRDSATLVIREVNVFWEKARIPVQHPTRCAEKLLRLYERHRNVQKNVNRTGEKFVKERTEFCDELNDLFDIAHGNALALINIEYDKLFLIGQRKKGRVGFMYGIDTELDKKEQRQAEKIQKEEERAKKNASALRKLHETCNPVNEFESSDDLEATSTADDELNMNEPGSSQSLTKRNKPQGSISVMTPKVVAALDKCKISDREAVHLVSSVAQALGFNLNSIITSRSSIRRSRRKLRLQGAEKIKQYFKEATLSAAVIHWDGKLFPNDKGPGKHDRLAIILTSGDVEKLLAVPVLSGGSGKEQAKAVYGELIEWNLTEKVKGLCCDTTSSNLGHLNGASIVLEQMLERSLLYFPCRHHIYEIYLKAAFEIKIPHSPGPKILLFSRFNDKWPEIDKSNFKSLIDDDDFDNFEIDIPELLNFIKGVLNQRQPRDDYEEFLKLTMVILGETEGVKFRAPGAYNQTRWMAKAIYTLKIYLFREQFDLSPSEENSLRELCIFIVKLYVRVWFTVPMPHKAPQCDLKFVKDVIDFEKIDADISKAVLRKIENHLWYLTPENACLAFFDEDICIEHKRKMLEALGKENLLAEGAKRLKVANIYDLKEKEIYDFINVKSNTLWERLELPDDFLGEDPTYWEGNKSYQSSHNVIKKIKVINDAAERGVKLISEYEKVLTLDEEQRQSIMQTVAEYRKRFKKIDKQSMSQSF